MGNRELKELYNVVNRNNIIEECTDKEKSEVPYEYHRFVLRSLGISTQLTEMLFGHGLIIYPSGVGFGFFKDKKPRQRIIFVSNGDPKIDAKYRKKLLKVIKDLNSIMFGPMAADIDTKLSVTSPTKTGLTTKRSLKDVYDSISKEKLNELLEYANYGRDEITAYRTAVISTLVKCLLKPYKGRIIISVLTYYSEVTTDYITVVNIVLIANDCHEDYELRGTIRKKIENIISESFPDISKNVFVNLMLGCIGR